MAGDALYYAKHNGLTKTVPYKDLIGARKIITTGQIYNSHAEMFLDGSELLMDMMGDIK
jgi:hypothetical protein